MSLGVDVTETGIDLYPDPSRVVARLFEPGHQEIRPGYTPAARLCERVCQLEEQTVSAAVRDIEFRFAGRHLDLHSIFNKHAAQVIKCMDLDMKMSPDRHLLLGALFTREYSIQGSSVCNPSAVLHPVQDESGDARFILSLRCIGGEHLSTIGFSTGRMTATGGIAIDEVGSFPQVGTGAPGVHYRSVLETKLTESDHHLEDIAYVLGLLPQRFDNVELNAHLEKLSISSAPQRQVSALIAQVRDIAKCFYQVDFPSESTISERVLWPQISAESHGMEDARFVRFIGEDGEVTYYASYTAFTGATISQQLLETKDFITFTSSPLVGAATVGKGLALFPRKIQGQYFALTRTDRESNAIASSTDLRVWNHSTHLQFPQQPWEIIQLGNCGSPIETEAGWLVLTHGVGAMRTYSMSAILLDLEDPQRVLARLKEPLLTPRNDRRDGYIPNIVYSCGGFAHNDTLVLPYGNADETISIATLPISQLLHTLQTNQ
jgi:predicted GH43/DUF377 family glycosyl hydrolase